MDKIVATVNPAIPAPILLNAVGHALLGLGANLKTSDLNLRLFKDKSGLKLGELTDHPLIILKAKKTIHLLTGIEDAIARELPVCVFVQSHRLDSPLQQEQRISAKDIVSNDIIAFVTAGSSVVLRQVTKRFSLYDSNSAEAALLTN